MAVDSTLPSRKRPLLPPTNSPSCLEGRSSNVHDLLNHSDIHQQRLTSQSPASSAGPMTPGNRLPSVNTLARPLYDARKQFLFSRPPSPISSRLVPHSRLIDQNDGRRSSDTSIFSTTSPTTSVSSSFGRRATPPIHSTYQTPDGNFQFITSGGIMVPLDTQQASRLADEKRKRNAGASARFRQRRKEKEKESATAISRLETRVKELEDMNIWYRSERDHLRQICISQGLQSQIGSRSISPRLKKMTPIISTTSTPSEWRQQHEERYDEEVCHQRRRLGDYLDGMEMPIRSSQQQAAVGQQPSIAHNPHISTPLVSLPSIANTGRTHRNEQHHHHHYHHRHERHYSRTR